MEIDLKTPARPEDVLAFVGAILAGESNLNANLANIVAVLNQYLPRINWVGFYLLEAHSKDWVLGPFAGKPACTRISPSRGVVGKALQNRQALVVDDVREFPDHIACDPDSRAEVVVPVVVEDRVVAGLDVDSPYLKRFGPEDVTLLEAVCGQLADSWPYAHWY
ncbi:MAG: histidine kinase [Sulfobacillus acidophilus]|uniref:Histidine kinase n=1 Tax=Sulfobacillus acidophilus TaxID=53633 RepID=A0A2T2WFC9_9FIRM|nr:MAG: histidine kinase [Sulfobacillus acidophilus]